MTDSPSWVAQLREEETAIACALMALPDHYRQIIELRNFQLLTFTEIGRRMGRSQDASRKLWSRAINALGQLLENNHEGWRHRPA